VAAEVEPFFRDLPARIAASHLAISRSGASTVAELAAIGRPAILVPLPHALDHDQRANAGMLGQAGGAIVMEQTHFTPDRVAAEIAGSPPLRTSSPQWRRGTRPGHPRRRGSAGGSGGRNDADGGEPKRKAV